MSRAQGFKWFHFHFEGVYGWQYISSNRVSPVEIIYIDEYMSDAVLISKALGQCYDTTEISQLDMEVLYNCQSTRARLILP